jgi:CheY-like chemotaxis protein
MGKIETEEKTTMARILVIDDENNIRLMVRIALQAAGHEVETAGDGYEGLEKFGAGENWDVVVLDQRMPGMEGLEVLQAMRRLNPAVRVVMITAFGTIDLAAQALKAGATNFLRKPFTTDVLRGAVQSAIEGTSVTQAGSDATQPSSPLREASINGFRIVACNGGGIYNGGAVSHSFIVRTTGGETIPCEVVLPDYFTELVKAHTDREALPDAEHFWLWLCEEALANYLWQHASLPPGGKLQVDELTTSLRRWMDAVLTS